ncbi:MAG: hypothetical protein WC796_05680 [Candidatus Pacearchaeota archaeon]|jgi:hypothetical protein
MLSTRASSDRVSGSSQQLPLYAAITTSPLSGYIPPAIGEGLIQKLRELRGLEYPASNIKSD